MEKKHRPNMKADVLLKIADMLETDPDVRAEFELSIWGKRNPRPGCGFAGCAIGWAVHKGIVPELEEALDGRAALGEGAVKPVHAAGHDHFDAVQLATGLSREDAMRLFSITRYSSSERLAGKENLTVPPDVVACRIRTLVAGDD